MGWGLRMCCSTGWCAVQQLTTTSTRYHTIFEFAAPLADQRIMHCTADLLKTATLVAACPCTSFGSKRATGPRVGYKDSHFPQQCRLHSTSSARNCIRFHV